MPGQSLDALEVNDSIGSPWYALYTKHQHEKSAARTLINKGFETLLPLYSAKHQWKDRVQKVDLPLFPCYVFVRTGLDRRVDILKTPGVFWFVGNGEYASAIPSREIEAVRRITLSAARFEPYSFLKTGDRVRVIAGPLIGLEGLLVRMKSRCRIVLSVQLLKQAVAVEVDMAEIQPVRTTRAIDALNFPVSKQSA
jgi:transcription antitermination factor NusG